MSRRPWIVLFEDRDKRRNELGDLIQAEIPSTYRIFRFDPKHGTSTTGRAVPKNPPTKTSGKKSVSTSGPAKGAYEDQLRGMFSIPKFAEIALFVTDRDLSRSDEFPGLSEAAVSKAAALLDVPVCVYSAGTDDSVLERQRSGGDGRIILDSSDFPKMAHRIAVLAKGFEQLRSDLVRVMKSPAKSNGPAMLLARALGQPDASGHIALYVSGDQRMIAEMMPVKDASSEVVQHQRVNTALGTWLYDSVFRFPGVLLDSVAAASFLNIQPKQFRETAIQKLFSSALYDGPFVDDENPRWWRHLLGDLLNESKSEDGRAFAAKKTKSEIAPCTCSVDHKSPAGFICAVTLKPVCKLHSVGQVGWLPRGADLTRVTKDIFDELSPWIGVS